MQQNTASCYREEERSVKKKNQTLFRCKKSFDLKGEKIQRNKLSKEKKPH